MKRLEPRDDDFNNVYVTGMDTRVRAHTRARGCQDAFDPVGQEEIQGAAYGTSLTQVSPVHALELARVYCFTMVVRVLSVASSCHR
jgi:hypothetical protein